MSAFYEPARDVSEAAVPSGTVTFVFTDIEGSTRRWERDPAAMQLAVRRHDTILRTEIERHRGYVFKTIGDAFCASFSRPQAALTALLAVQRALAAEDFAAVDGIRVRAAIHAGTADERDGDYFGPTVNRVARLLAIGHGGQVLLSGVASELVRGALPPHASLRDLGEHRLKDLSRPERVFQLLAPGLPHEFPPLQSLDALPNNLPIASTSFVGREREMAEIAGLLAAQRLVTLTGSGGIGKTRTSLQVAATLLESFRDGVWFVELAPLADGALVAPTIAAALGLSIGTSGDALDNLVRALGSKRLLLVFDNCEHLIESAAGIVSALLRGCPNLKVLASSRQGLGIAAEAAYRMPSLGVPQAVATERLDASVAAIYPALALFVDRARASDRAFVLGDDNAYAVADICRRLDGIPLAIELAAARVKILSPRQLRDRLDERFRVLTGGSRDVLPRQQTLRALIDWSYDLLDERERKLFRRLAIFVDGFTLEAVAAVASDDDIDEFDVLDLLSSLVDKSLVLVEPEGETMRYRLLESTNAYACQRLAEARERDDMVARHLRYMRDCVVAAASVFDATGRSGDFSDGLRTELGNLRAALDNAYSGVDLVAGAEILVNVDYGWSDLGIEREASDRIEAFLAKLFEPDPVLVARLYLVRARIAGSFGVGSLAIDTAAAAVACARSSGNTKAILEALIVYAWNAAVAQRFDEADANIREAEGLCALSPRLRLAILNTRAFVCYHRGDLAESARLFDRLRNEHRALGNPTRERMLMLALAEVEHGRGRTEAAIALVREVLAGLGPRFLIFRASLLTNLAGYLIAIDDRSGAHQAAREAIELLREHEPDAAFIINAMLHLAVLLALAQEYAQAARLLGYVDAVNARHGYSQEHNEQRSRERLLAIVKPALEDGELSALLAEGAAFTPRAAIALALY